MVDIVLGFDFGIKRIGIAMGNTLTGQAQPLSVIKAIDNATRFKLIGELTQHFFCEASLPRRARAHRRAHAGF